MSNNQNKFSNFAPALGLIFGGGAALIVAVLANLNIAITMSIGAALGLVIGSVVYGFKKRQQNK